MTAGRHEVKYGRPNRKKPGSHKRRGLVLALVLVLVCIAGGAVYGTQLAAAAPAAASAASQPAQTPEPTAPSPTPEPTAIVSTVRFSASGDDLIHSRIYEQAAQNASAGDSYDFSSCYEHLASFYSGCDVNWINQETLVNDTLPPSTYPCFSTPGACAKALYDVGIRVFSLSNNHTYDKGDAGIAATQAFWASMPADVVTTGLWAGEADYDRIPLQQVNGVTIAYLSYTAYTNGNTISADAAANVILTSQTDVIQHQVTLAAQKADFVVVGVHWGVEYSHEENESQRTLAQQLTDWGADVIIGTHPHVLQNAAWLQAADGRKTFVAYSLGNFISAQDQSDRMVGAILTFDLQKTTAPDGTVTTEILSPALHPTVTHYTAGMRNITTYLYRDYTPELASEHGVRRYDSSFSYDFIKQLVQDTIDPEFLDLT